VADMTAHEALVRRLSREEQLSKAVVEEAACAAAAAAANAYFRAEEARALDLAERLARRGCGAVDAAGAGADAAAGAGAGATATAGGGMPAAGAAATVPAPAVELSVAVDDAGLDATANAAASLGLLKDMGRGESLGQGGGVEGRGIGSGKRGGMKHPATAAKAVPTCGGEGGGGGVDGDIDENAPLSSLKRLRREGNLSGGGSSLRGGAVSAAGNEGGTGSPGRQRLCLSSRQGKGSHSDLAVSEGVALALVSNPSSVLEALIIYPCPFRSVPDFVFVMTHFFLF